MFLHSRVKSGRYPTTSAVVREALRLLECQDTEIPAFRYWDTGIPGIPGIPGYRIPYRIPGRPELSQADFAHFD